MLIFLMGCAKFLMSPYQREWSGVAAGPYDACAWRSDNYIACATLKVPFSPVIPEDDDLWTEPDYAGIAVGDDAACTLLKGEKTPRCWGAEENPIVSVTNTTDTGDSNADVTPPTLDPKSLVAADQFACGLEESGTAHCWGDNDKNQVSGVVDKKYTTIILGSQHACGLQDGVLHCWGEASAAGAAQALATDVTLAAAGGNITCVQTPIRVICSRNPTDPTAPQEPYLVTDLPGPHRALAVGEMGLCGINDKNRLSCVWNPARTAPTLPAEPLSHISLSSRRSFGCGITEAGRLVCFGEDAPDLESFNQ